MPAIRCGPRAYRCVRIACLFCLVWFMWNIKEQNQTATSTTSLAKQLDSSPQFADGRPGYAPLHGVRAVRLPQQEVVFPVQLTQRNESPEMRPASRLLRNPLFNLQRPGRAGVSRLAPTKMGVRRAGARVTCGHFPARVGSGEGAVQEEVKTAGPRNWSAAPGSLNPRVGRLGNYRRASVETQSSWTATRRKTSPQRGPRRSCAPGGCRRGLCNSWSCSSGPRSSGSGRSGAAGKGEAQFEDGPSRRRYEDGSVGSGSARTTICTSTWSGSRKGQTTCLTSSTR